MYFYSTRNANHQVSIENAILNGIAPDGGLYMPESFPDMYAVLEKENTTLQSISENLITPFLESYFTKEECKSIIQKSFHFDVPLIELNDKLFIAELFHGPTLAFKDFGGLFMANVMSRILAKQNKKLTILVATSGDTGGAVANGFFNKENIDVVILYPKGKVSVLQELQLTTFGGNITAICVDGTFDDCQQLVKSAFADTELSSALNLSSANSINIGRLIPQMIYYGFISHQFFKKHKVKPAIIVPSGNFGNITAGLFVQKMGYPIERFIAATNANDVVPTYFDKGNYEPRPSVRTLSNAMDVGAPSNMERIQCLFDNDLNKMKETFSSFAVSDKATEETMRHIYKTYSYIADPHTAVGIHIAEQENANGTSIVMSTAHPAKFKEDVERILNIEIALPKQLSDLLDKPIQKKELENDFSVLKNYLLHERLSAK